MYSDDPEEFIKQALKPADVLRVVITNPNPDKRACKVVVPDNQLSLAIGRDGQNARLAVKLTGWKIDIKSNSQIEEEISRLEQAEMAAEQQEI